MASWECCAWRFNQENITKEQKLFLGFQQVIYFYKFITMACTCLSIWETWHFFKLKAHRKKNVRAFLLKLLLILEYLIVYKGLVLASTGRKVHTPPPHPKDIGRHCVTPGSQLWGLYFPLADAWHWTWWFRLICGCFRAFHSKSNIFEWDYVCPIKHNGWHFQVAGFTY